MALDTESVINVSSVPQRSPFRYPGGKTWLVPYIRIWLRSNSTNCQQLIEPFAGGAIVGLTAAFEGLARNIRLVERDPDVGAVWKCVLGGRAKWLADRITGFRLTDETARAVLSSRSKSIHERAFATILRNRVQRGGILAPGAGMMKEGENGKGLHSRWYPETLSKRILAIGTLRDRIRFTQGDGMKFIERNAHRKNVSFFIDPPYTFAGRRLYKYSEIDHEKLFYLARRICGDFLMTYDDSSEIRQLAIRTGFDMETVAMKNTHNARMEELLIGKSLRWLRSGSIKEQASAEFSAQKSRDSRGFRQSSLLPLAQA
jgi:DNA adenine methylase